jgi:hypothetical protein
MCVALCSRGPQPGQHTQHRIDLEHFSSLSTSFTCLARMLHDFIKKIFVYKILLLSSSLLVFSLALSLSGPSILQQITMKWNRFYISIYRIIIFPANGITKCVLLDA